MRRQITKIPKLFKRQGHLLCGPTTKEGAVELSLAYGNPRKKVRAEIASNNLSPRSPYHETEELDDFADRVYEIAV
jgi:hypothetical protein